MTKVLYHTIDSTDSTFSVPYVCLYPEIILSIITHNNIYAMAHVYIMIKVYKAINCQRQVCIWMLQGDFTASAPTSKLVNA